MPEGIRPRVNEAKEFLEIAKDFKDPREILREALSNSWDAGASTASIRFSLMTIPGTRRRKIMVEISDDGEGMSSDPRPSVGCSELESFFNLGDSNKPFGSIGSKGHGTKIYYKSNGIVLKTWKNGKSITAESEMPPWDSLVKGIVPTYRYAEEEDVVGKGTRIKVDGFQAKQCEFESLDSLVQYLHWYTVLGSFGQYFNSPRKMDVDIQPLNSISSVKLSYGFKFPDEQPDLEKGLETVCKIFGPKTIDCGITEDGKKVSIDVIGAVIGEEHRKIVPDTYSHMGLWLCKDFIRIERTNYLLEAVFKGQYYYRSMLIFANCQHLDLTANRNNVRTDNDEYDLAVAGIKIFCDELKKSEFVTNYFEAKKMADQQKQEQDNEQKAEERKEQIRKQRKERLNRYKARPELKAKGLIGAPLKEPQNESELALLLQAMISSNHPGVDFIIGDYNTNTGVDLLVEQVEKDIPAMKYVELVFSLDRLYQWSHPPQGYHIIVCFQQGAVKEVQKFPDGQEAKLLKKAAHGRYTLHVGSDAIDVYVLREILQA